MSRLDHWVVVSYSGFSYQYFSLAFIYLFFFKTQSTQFTVKDITWLCALVTHSSNIPDWFGICIWFCFQNRDNTSWISKFNQCVSILNDLTHCKDTSDLQLLVFVCLCLMHMHILTTVSASQDFSRTVTSFL